jgi:hypothetical protein
MTTKTCDNCAHQSKEWAEYARCVRVGYYCATEMASGGRCAGPATGVPQMNLWEPRRTFWMRLTGRHYEVKS